MIRVVASQYSRIISSGDAIRAGIECRGYRSEEEPISIKPINTRAERFYEVHPLLDKKLEPLRQLCLQRR